jgi:hypothetical protein
MGNDSSCLDCSGSEKRRKRHDDDENIEPMQQLLNEQMKKLNGPKRRRNRSLSPSARHMEGLSAPTIKHLERVMARDALKKKKKT